ncbi:DUF2878 domain-containing protein [Dyella japonica]|uniref:DUF2878 domain-containing protein n=1 Tax=Dyella japonica TaxID=231455 RepID=A0ABV2JSC9_9GAMM
MTFWINLVGYQSVWFLLVRGAAQAHLALPLLAGAVFVLGQLLTSQHPSRDARLLVAALLMGLLVDGVAASTGWLDYASRVPAWPPQGAPVWILMLWACFATTIPRSLSVLRSRPWLAALAGGLGAPMSYLAAARGWGAVQVSSWPGLPWIAACWALALPLLGALSQYDARRDESSRT